MICVDASLAAKWIIAEEYSDRALRLLATWVADGERICAPPLLTIEVTNIIRRRMLREGVTLPQAQRLLRQFLAFPVTAVNPAALYERALTLAVEHGLPAVYDAHYVALAELLGYELWTNDRRLLRALGGKLSFVKWIGDYPG